MAENCIFCKIARKEMKFELVAESDRFIAIRDSKPRVPGHTLVIPKQHFVTLLDIPNSWGEEMLSFTKKVSGMLLDEKWGDGFNILMNNLEVAGQMVMHAHLHIIPRNEGDGLRMIS